MQQVFYVQKKGGKLRPSLLHCRLANPSLVFNLVKMPFLMPYRELLTSWSAEGIRKPSKEDLENITCLRFLGIMAGKER